MAKYYVTLTAEFAGEIEAETEAQAEEMAWTSWGVSMDDLLMYQCVDSIEVEELEDDEEEED